MPSGLSLTDVHLKMMEAIQDQQDAEILKAIYGSTLAGYDYGEITAISDMVVQKVPLKTDVPFLRKGSLLRQATTATTATTTQVEAKVLSPRKPELKVPAAPTALMKVIGTAPKTHGRRVMLFCPEETPQHVEAIWQHVEHDGAIAWEGWIFADPILADVEPLGPQGATHWYEPPSVDAFIAPRPAADELSYDRVMALVKQASIPETKEPPAPAAKDHLATLNRPPIGYDPRIPDSAWQRAMDSGRFTFLTLAEMRRASIHPEYCRTQKRNFIRASSLDRLGPTSPDEMDAVGDLKSEKLTVDCPIVAIGETWHEIINHEGRYERIGK